MTDHSAAVERMTGRTVSAARPLTGGDVSQVTHVTFGDGGTAVVKTGGPLRTEARMLQAIAGTGCRVAGVIDVSDDLLILEALPEGRASETGWQDAGANIAKLHASLGEGYGWDEDHAIGAASQPGGWRADWPSFWAERRLLAWPESLPTDIARRLEALARRLPDLLPKEPPASLLHGDLWTGNLIFDGNFQGLIDPASYHGDAEVDLAALTTFGTPPPSFWDGYGPLREGWEARRPIYRLWIANLHLRLFGQSYRPMVERCLDAVDG